MPAGRAPRRTASAGRSRQTTSRRATPMSVVQQPRADEATARRTRPVYTQEEQDSKVRIARQRMALGESPLDVAQVVGVSYPTLLRWLKRDGYQPRSRGGRRGAASTPRTQTRTARTETRSATSRPASGANGAVHFDLKNFVDMNRDVIIETMLSDKSPEIRNAIKGLLSV